jgi:hypothetical protein
MCAIFGDEVCVSDASQGVVIFAVFELVRKAE